MRATVKSTNITSTKQSLKPREHFGLHPTTFNFTFFQAAIEAPSSPLLLFLQSSAF